MAAIVAGRSRIAPRATALRRPPGLRPRAANRPRPKPDRPACDGPPPDVRLAADVHQTPHGPRRTSDNPIWPSRLCQGVRATGLLAHARAFPRPTLCQVDASDTKPLFTFGSPRPRAYGWDVRTKGWDGGPRRGLLSANGPLSRHRSRAREHERRTNMAGLKKLGAVTLAILFAAVAAYMLRPSGSPTGNVVGSEPDVPGTPDAGGAGPTSAPPPAHGFAAQNSNGPKQA